MSRRELERRRVEPWVGTQPSAHLSIWRDGSPATSQFVVVGSTLDLDGQHYEVIRVDDASHPGSIALRPSITTSPNPAASGAATRPLPRLNVLDSGLRLELAPLELGHLEAFWEPTGELTIEMRTGDDPPVNLSMTFHTSAVPGGAGRFEAHAISAILSSRTCALTGTMTAAAIPAQLTRDGTPFNPEIDATLGSCDPDLAIRGRAALRGTLHLLLRRALPRGY